MIPALSLALLLAVGAVPGRDARPPEEDVVELAEITIRQRFEQVITRVRTLRAPPVPQSRWKEKKGPKCLATDMIAGAAVTGSDTIDFVLKGGTRLRAQLEDDCPAIDYYQGFYLAPTADRKLCADRDSIHARSGGECEIGRFRTLVPLP